MDWQNRKPKSQTILHLGESTVHSKRFTLASGVVAVLCVFGAAWPVGADPIPTDGITAAFGGNVDPADVNDGNLAVNGSGLRRRA